MIRNVISLVKAIKAPRMSAIPTRGFAFFNQQISDKYGKKCCRYHQDGKPLTPTKAQQIKESVEVFVQGWKLNEQRTKLIRYFFIEDYTMGVQFIKDVAKIDALNFQNCPSFSMQKGELLTVELYSPPLNGLSQLDFQMAMKINEMDFNFYFLIPVEEPVNYIRTVQTFRMKKQNDEIQKQLQADLDALSPAKNGEQKQQNSN